MERTYKFRLYPNRLQSEQLNNQITLCQRLYNAALEQRIIYYRNDQIMNFAEQSRQLVAIRKNLDDYAGIYSHALCDVMKRLDRAYRSFFRRVRLGKVPGFPRFKSRKRYHSLTFDRYGFRLLDNGHVNLTKIGNVRMFRHRAIEGEPRTCIIKCDSQEQWWVTVSVKLPDVLPVDPITVVGVDVGIEKLATLSTGEMIANPKFAKKLESKVKRLQRKASRKLRGSKNRKKVIKKLVKVHDKIQRKRDNYLHKISRALVIGADVIVFENLQIKNMLKNHYLAGSISDASWGKLMRYTAYKAEGAGKHVYFVNPSGTSQLCSRCGATVRKSLAVRFHVCTTCGFSADRDLNAALNILDRLRTDCAELFKTPLESVPLPIFLEMGYVCSVKKEAHNL